MFCLFFQNSKSRPPLQCNHPPKSGAIYWARTLQKRLKKLVIAFQQVPEIRDFNIKKKAFVLYTNVSQKLLEYEENIFSQWLHESIVVIGKTFCQHILRIENGNKVGNVLIIFLTL